MAVPRVQRRLTAIVAADVAGYSRLIEDDEEGTRKRLTAIQDDLIAPRVTADGGRIFKTMGDGILIEYPSVVDAVRSAVEIQEGIRRQNSIIPEDSKIKFRVGINVGDVIVEGDDFHGQGVNVAARLEGICEPGEVYVSSAVYDQVAGKLSMTFDDLGHQRVKNIAKPIPVYRVSLESEGSDELGATGATMSVPEKPSIAVLPFANMSSDSDQEYFADGISEDIITALSRISWFFVIARNTTFTYKGQAVDVRRVAKELGVRYVVEGSVQKAGNRIRITGQLVDGETGNHLWAEKYDRDLEDVFAIQDEITENIAGAVEPQILAAENFRSQRKSERSLDAWDLVIRAMARIGEFSKSGSKDALVLLDRALEIDPKYARAHSQKAWTIAWRSLQGWEDMEAALPISIEAAEKAIQYDPNEPWAYIGWIFISIITHDPRKTLSSALRAIELNPNFALAHSFVGVAHTFDGRGAEAFDWIAKAPRLSPRDVFRDEFDLHASFAHFQVGAYEEAAAFAAKASMPRPEHIYPHLIAAASFAHSDAIETARDEIAKIGRMSPEYNLAAFDKVCVFGVEEDKARFIDGLRKAGLPP
jgi:adenylate cyclase